MGHFQKNSKKSYGSETSDMTSERLGEMFEQRVLHAQTRELGPSSRRDWKFPILLRLP
jgi:hypothetical protein